MIKVSINLDGTISDVNYYSSSEIAIAFMTLRDQNQGRDIAMIKVDDLFSFLERK